MVLAKLKGKYSSVRNQIPINAKSKKLKKKRLGLIYFFVILESLGKRKIRIMRNGVKIRR